MTIKEGDTLPDVTFTTMTADGPTQVTTDEVFKGRTVALFAVPGAFTPTCSARHLPGFIEKAGELKQKGIDRIACTAVNDAFVLDAWAGEHDARDTVMMLADGNADFAREIGLVIDISKFGMGIRSQRYSMVVEDKVVKRLFVEESGDFKLSSAEHMLDEL